MQDKFPKPLTPFPIRDKFKKKKKERTPRHLFIRLTVEHVFYKIPQQNLIYEGTGRLFVEFVPSNPSELFRIEIRKHGIPRDSQRWQIIIYRPIQTREA